MASVSLVIEHGKPKEERKVDELTVKYMFGVNVEG